MFKQVFTLFRGTANEAAQNFTDKNALTILRQQINDSAKAVQAGRKAVAIAMAQNKQEKEQYQIIASRITDLEERTIIALEKGKKKIAQEAAGTIALLEAERDVSAQAVERFEVEITRLRNKVRDAEQRLTALKNGQRIAAVTDKTQAMNSASNCSSQSSLKEAEETLLRLRVRQKQIDNTAEAMDEMAQEGSFDQVIDKLADAGCGASKTSNADDILKRLSKQIKKSA